MPAGSAETRVGFTARLALLLLLAAAPLAAPAEESPPPANALALRAGVFVLVPKVAGNQLDVTENYYGPDLELSWSHTVWELVSLELAAGGYTVVLTGTGTRLSVLPLSVSLKISAAPEWGWEAYMVVGAGASLTKLSGGTLSQPASVDASFQAGLGATHPWGARGFFGVDGRYAFHEAATTGRLDGFRLSALLGTRF